MSTIRRIVFVPGKNPKPPVAQHREWLRRSLCHGVARVDPALAAELSAAGASFQLAGWNRTYYRRTRRSEGDAAWIEALWQRTEASAAERAAARSWRRRAARVLYAIADALPWLIDVLPDRSLRNTVKETARYFDNRNGIARAVREVVKASLRGPLQAHEPILLIGHSMGSIIAYDALWELWHEEGITGRVDLFLTLGSPLGMRFVQRRLLGHEPDGQRTYPGNIRRWVNVAAEGDLTALDPILCDDFRPLLALGLTEAIEDYHTGVFTYFRDAYGLNFHRSYGYLVHPAVAGIVADWWQGRTVSTDIPGAGKPDRLVAGGAPV